MAGSILTIVRCRLDTWPRRNIWQRSGRQARRPFMIRAANIALERSKGVESRAINNGTLNSTDGNNLRVHPKLDRQLTAHAD